ncbi:MAG: TolC family protein [Gammaproteobacteria bacterium]|nr:TolC family protein [Gammaproteobacteria bacterium]
MPLWLRRTTTALSVALLCGCVVQPVELSDEEVTSRVRRDIDMIDRWSEPATAPISLAEAMARALKYNLDYRLEWSKRVLAQTELEVSHYDLLPDLIASIRTDHRNNFSGSSSRSLTTGRQSLETSTSQDRDILTTDLELSWNVLDFGLSYYRARQSANEVLIASEEKRKVIHRLLQNVRTAYWRSVTAHRLSQRLTALRSDVDAALGRNKGILDRRLDSPLTALTFRRELIDIRRQLQELEENFRIAKIQLASLMNFRNPDDFEIVIPGPQPPPTLNYTTEQLEELALRLRPELRQVDYRRRIATDSARSSLIELLPAPRISVSGNWNDNSFLFNNNWLVAGAQVTWNLVRLLRYPALKKKALAEEQLLDARSLTLSMAILTQVRVSVAQYLHSQSQLATHSEYQQTQQRIDTQVARMLSAKSIGRQARIREGMNTLLSEVRYDVASANVQSAFANVFMASGLDPSIPAPETLSLKQIINLLEENWPTF